jgi:Uma2 family endonuclease
MPALKQRFLSPAEYLEAETHSPIRHEYLNGELYAMTGTSQRHNLITTNLFLGLHRGLGDRPCLVFLGDVKLQVAAANAFYYPDLMVVCRAEGVLAGEAQLVTDPRLVAEVLSPSTEGIDRREKLAAYRQLPSLEEYMLVAQERRLLEI